MALNTLLRTSTVLYEEKHMQENEQLFKFLFTTEDIDTSASFLLDEFIQDDYAIAYRDESNQAHIRPYQAGSGALYTPPRASEKTPIDETLRDVTPEGIEATSGFNVAQMRKTDKILSIHQTAHNMTKNKQAIDVLRTGVFYAKGITDKDIGKDEDYARDVANSLTADYSAVTIDDSLAAINNQLDAQGCPKDGRSVIMGDSQLKEFQTDSNVQARMQANTANVLVRQTINPPRQYDGLFWVAEYLPTGSVSPLQIYSYSPGIQYKPYKGATAEDWIPAAEMIGFSTASKTYRIYRGMDVKGGANTISRVAGELVFDSFTEDDPVAELLRSNTRHIFLYGNINHTVVSTGSNFN